jgi:hypothetical protein
MLRLLFYNPAIHPLDMQEDGEGLMIRFLESAMVADRF